jgi:hypothetical protein
MQTANKLLWKELNNLQLIDTFRAVHPSALQFTRVRGHPSKSRIDRILTTPGHPSQIVSSEHIDFGPLVSDHVAVRTSFTWTCSVFPLAARTPNFVTPHPQSFKQVPKATLEELGNMKVDFLTHLAQLPSGIDPAVYLKQFHMVWHHLLHLIKKHCSIPSKQKANSRMWNPKDYTISNPKLLRNLKDNLSPQIPITFPLRLRKR